MPVPPLRLRQAVLAARDLDRVCERLRDELPLQEPYSDPGVAYFGLRNAVFALGDTFLEVVSPTRPDTAAGRLLDRRGGDCGYMLMFQLEDLEGARARARSLGIREVFEVALEDMEEVHLHPADMRGAIVSLSRPNPASAWRWGGERWSARSAELRLAGAVVGVGDADAVGERWRSVLGTPAEAAGVSLVADERERGLIEILLACSDKAEAGGRAPRAPFEIAGVRFMFNDEEER